MDKTITIVVNNRFRYLNILCESLSKNNLSNYKIYAFLEPDGIKCKEILEKYLNCEEIIINSYNFGVTWNSIQAWNYIFEKKKSFFNLFLEEDVILSPDAINLTNWFINNYFNDPTKMAIILHNYTKTPINNTICKLYKRFTTFGMGITSKIWFDLYRNNITSDMRGWDFSIDKLLKSNTNLYTVLPEFSRANHIGKYGTHCSPEFHDNTFGDLCINENVISQEDFILTNEIS